MLARPQLVLYLDAHLLCFIGCFHSSLVSWMPIFLFAVGWGQGGGQSITVHALDNGAGYWELVYWGLVNIWTLKKSLQKLDYTFKSESMLFSI